MFESNPDGGIKMVLLFIFGAFLFMFVLPAASVALIAVGIYFDITWVLVLGGLMLCLYGWLRWRWYVWSKRNKEAGGS